MSIRNLAAAAAIAAIAGAASAGPLHFNDFETDTTGWNAFGGSLNATRVASGTNGITSSGGGFHAESSASGSASNLGGYNFGPGNVPTAFQPFSTSLDIFLNVTDPNHVNNSRFDFTSAVSQSSDGLHRRDFVFNVGFYDDNIGPGAGTDRFIISASNNADFNLNNAPARNGPTTPIAITASGWYTFAHKFYDNAGVLAVDMTITDSSDNLVATWTRSTPLDAINLIGGSRYQWFAANSMATLAFDNSELTLDNVIPLPTTGAMATLGLLALGARRRR